MTLNKTFLVITMYIYIYMCAVFRVSNPNFVAWNCALLCGIVHNCSRIARKLQGLQFCESKIHLRVFVSLSIVFKNDRFVFGKKRSFRFRKKRSFLKRTHSFWTFRKRITIVSKNDRFYKNNLRPFFVLLFLKKRSLFQKPSFLKKKTFCWQLC